MSVLQFTSEGFGGVEIRRVEFLFIDFTLCTGALVMLEHDWASKKKL